MLKGFSELDKARMMAAGLYVVWSEEHQAWWGPEEAGYYPSLMLAGLYTRDRALEIARANESRGERAEKLLDALADQQARYRGDPRVAGLVAGLLGAE